jgi:hypothetical protein
MFTPNRGDRLGSRCHSRNLAVSKGSEAVHQPLDPLGVQEARPTLDGRYRDVSDE